MSIKKGRRLSQDEDSSYIMSISDLMSGLVFIFIIILVYFVIHYKSVNKSLASRDATRTRILQTIKEKIEEKELDKNLAIVIDAKNGVIHIRDKADQMFFRSGKAVPEENGVIVIEGLSDLLKEIVPCYTTSHEEYCMLLPHPKKEDRKLETIFIEGHTDSIPIYNQKFKSNWELSVARAIATYNILVNKNEILKNITNESGRRIFSVSGYGDTRPISESNNGKDCQQDRRIDLRFIMTPHDNEEIKKIMEKPLSAK